MGEIMNSPNRVKQYAIFDIIFHHIKLNDRKYNPVLNLSHQWVIIKIYIKVLFQLYDHYNIVAFSKHVNNFTEI